MQNNVKNEYNEFFHPVKIGSLVLEGNIFLAPVAGYSDRAFRSVCVKGGAAFCYTEMVSAEALVRGNQKTVQLMKRALNEKSYAVQIFGGNPEVMAKAAKIVLSTTTADCIDINCGCPVPKIVQTGAGASLTRNPQKLYDVVKAVKNAVQEFCSQEARNSVPVTIKIRSGWDANEITWKESACAAMEAGVDAITIHPRTKAQGYEGKADWSILAALVELCANHIPVFGSGDVFSPQDAKEMLCKTKCSGVMFARGAMGKPFIFKQTREFLQNGTYSEIPLKTRIQAGFEELDILVQDLGEQRACNEMRKRFCAYIKGVEGGAALREKLVHASSVDEYHQILEKLSCE